MRIYIAGPYTASSHEEIDRNIDIARDAMASILKKGHTPFCPHSMTARFERDYPEIDKDIYLEIDIEWLRMCDAILMLDDWENSEGAHRELEIACDLNMKRFFSINQIPKRGE